MKDGQLQSRYTITHKDGKPINPEKRYLVLDMSDPDEREEQAIAAFIDACRAGGYPELAKSIFDALKRCPNCWVKHESGQNTLCPL